MVEAVCNHRENHISCGSRAEAFERHAYGKRDKVIVPYARYHAAHNAQRHTREYHDTLAELVAQGRNENYCNGHRNCAHYAEYAHRIGGAEFGSRINGVGERLHRSVLYRAGKLIEKIENYRHHKELIGEYSLGLFFERGTLYLDLFRLGRYRLYHTLFGYALAGEIVLREAADKRNHAYNYEHYKVAVGVGLGIGRSGEALCKGCYYLGEYYRACACAAEHRHIGEGCEKSPLLAVAGGYGHERAVCRVIQRESDCIEQVIRYNQPYHFKRSVVGHRLYEHKHACHCQHNRRKQDIRPCLARFRFCPLYNLPHEKVAQHD